MSDRLVVVRGAGDLGTGVAIRLLRSGFNVVMLESPEPLAVRRTVSFSEAVYDGRAQVEGIPAARADSADRALALTRDDAVPVVVDPAGQAIAPLRPSVVVDAILAKRNTGTRRDMAPLVIGLGPGFEAGDDVHAVVETNRGPDLGRVLWKGTAQPNTGEPARIMGYGVERVLRAPTEGSVSSLRPIGATVQEGEQVADVSGEPVFAPFRGVLRGLIRDGTTVPTGLKIGDVDPRLDPTLCYRVSDKSLAIAGGVLEAILSHLSGRLIYQ